MGFDPNNTAGFPFKSYMQRVGLAIVSLTTANGANPAVTSDKAKLVESAVRDGEGSIVVTLKIKGVKVWCVPNLRSTGDAKVNVDAITEGNTKAVIAVTTTLATAADDIPGAIVDLVIFVARS